MQGCKKMFDIIQRLGMVSSYICLRYHRHDALVTKWEAPHDWIEHYTLNAFAFRDPIMMFAFSKEGFSRFDQIPFPDPCGVLKDAAHFGLTYGMVASAGPVHARSYCVLTRSDRRYTDKEMSRVHRVLTVLHYMHEQRKIRLTDREKEVLRSMASGMNYETTGENIGISFSAVKARLSKARRKLGVRTTLEAVHEAHRSGML